MHTVDGFASTFVTADGVLSGAKGVVVERSLVGFFDETLVLCDFKATLDKGLSSAIPSIIHLPMS